MNEEIQKPLTESRAPELPNGGLSVKHANIFYLIHIVFTLVLGAIKIPGLPTTWFPIAYYIPLLVVAFLLCRKESKTIGTAFGFHSVKPLTILLTIVTCIGMHSVSHLISSLTDLVFPSFIEAASEEFHGRSFLVNFIGVSLIPPFFEEFVVRDGICWGVMSKQGGCVPPFC